MISFGQLKQINDQRWINYSTCLLAFASPFPTPYSSVAIAIWAVVNLFFRGRSCVGNLNDTIRERRFFPALLLLFFYSICLLSSCYATEPSLTFRSLFNAKVPWLIIPLVILVCKPEIHLTDVLRSYVLGVFLFVLFSFALVTIGFYRGDNLMVFFGNPWREVTASFYDIMNRVYSGVHCAIALIFIGYLFLKKSVTVVGRAYYLVVAAVLLFFMYVNMSRSAVLSFCIVGLIAVVLVMRAKLSYVVSAIVFFLIVGCAIFFTDNRFSHSMKVYSFEKSVGMKSSEPRAVIWPAALRIASHHFFYGCGENNSQLLLTEEYKKIGFQQGACQKFGTHNQYLEAYLELGWIGLIILLALLVSVPFCADGRRKKLALLVTLLFVLVFTTESLASRATGALTFSLILNLLSCTGDCKTYFKKEYKCCWSVLTVLAVVLVTGFSFLLNKQMNSKLQVANVLRYKTKQSGMQDGYMTFCMDKSSCLVAADNNSYGYRLVAITRDKTLPRDVQLECYVSPDFNGEWVRVVSTAANMMERTSAVYDMSKKGTWQKIHMVLPVGDNYVFTYVCKANSFDFSDMNGQVLFRNLNFE